MKLLIIGNEGYIGPVLARYLRRMYPDIYLAGFDAGYFAHKSVSLYEYPERFLDVQYRGDVRNFPQNILEGFDSVIYLAAISNDPMGKEFEEVTLDVNYKSAIKIAKAAKAAGVQNFVFASSCSVYGSAGTEARTEISDVNPLTAYAISKVKAEIELAPLADNNFIVTCHRFATACGFSPRIRLDLVLNDFVASAMTTKEIKILSDGTPWRPLIHVSDMARAMEWSMRRKLSEGGGFLILNTGSNMWNYQIKDLAFAVRDTLGDCSVSINEKAEPDNRSYKVDFSKFHEIAADNTPQISLKLAADGLITGLGEINFSDRKFRSSDLIRLNVLRKHITEGRLTNLLKWT
jgi:nucleoside-diphosphate-sugar epimerase